jgi:hypothetical protein
MQGGGPYYGDDDPYYWWFPEHPNGAVLVIREDGTTEVCRTYEATISALTRPDAPEVTNVARVRSHRRVDDDPARYDAALDEIMDEIVSGPFYPPER